MHNSVGFGIFMWTASERQRDRYGAFYMTNATFNNDAFVEPRIDLGRLTAFVGKKVKVACRVIENRDSGHAGDRFLEIYPSKPDVGEVVELGVAILALEPTFFSSGMQVIMQPGDGRAKFWINPHRLYRLHDQTVELYITETDDEFTPAPTFGENASEGMKANGDGTLQTKNVQLRQGMKIAPRFISLGDGLFSVDQNYQAGDDVEIIEP